MKISEKQLENQLNEIVRKMVLAKNKKEVKRLNKEYEKVYQKLEKMRKDFWDSIQKIDQNCRKHGD